MAGFIVLHDIILYAVPLVLIMSDIVFRYYRARQPNGELRYRSTSIQPKRVFPVIGRTLFWTTIFFSPFFLLYAGSVKQLYEVSNLTFTLLVALLFTLPLFFTYIWIFFVAHVLVLRNEPKRLRKIAVNFEKVYDESATKKKFVEKWTRIITAVLIAGPIFSTLTLLIKGDIANSLQGVLLSILNLLALGIFAFLVSRVVLLLLYPEIKARFNL